MWREMSSPALVLATMILLAGCANMMTIDDIETTPPPVASETDRNDWQNRKMAESTRACTALLNRLQERPRKMSLGMKTAAVVLGAWATGSTSLKDELTAGTQMFTVLDQTAAGSYPGDVQTVITGIQYGQESIRQEIRKRQGDELQAYGLGEAEDDLRRFHAVCSVGKGRAYAAQASAAGFAAMRISD